ncbi:MAG: UDPglucose 6-dehydrogenase [Myxococcota bacterium]|jgi:UDPglucose 6-dehydrogenase
MKLTVIGVGHVGLVTAATMAAVGHDVVGLDHDAAKLAALTSGRVPFYEPGLQELVDEQVAAGRLRFTSEMADAIDGAEVAFVCVGTPSLPGGAPNLSYVEQVGIEVAALAKQDLVLVEKSTVPANTGVRLGQIIAREQAQNASDVRLSVASNPEFLREGNAVEDTLKPDRIVIGASDAATRRVVRNAYEPLLAQHECPVIETDLATAELIKHASNAYLATRISFMNAVAQVCERVGADVRTVADGMGHDHRIGRHFLNAGIGYGGSCFPKDVDGFLHLSQSVGYNFGLLDEVRIINEQMLDLVMDKLRGELWHLEGKTVTLLGAAFKPGTDDLRRAPAMALAERLLAEQVDVRVYDPVALDNVRAEQPNVTCVADVMEAVTDAHAVVVCTEWPEVRALDLTELAAALKYPIVIDGRNIFEPDEARAAGLQYHGIGRGSVG